MSTNLATPPGMDELPTFANGWVTAAIDPAPFLSYVTFDASVNWSDELEELHEESSRNHFMDVWTRAAILERVAVDNPAPTILDLGCSTGYLLDDLSRAHPGGQLIGLDLVSAGLLKAHRLVPSARLLHADACQLPLVHATVDAVVSANLLEHVPDDRRVLSEIARVLRPGRRAVIVVPANPQTYDYYDRFLGHERRYARGELAAKGRDAGLEVVEDCYLGSLIYPAFWAVKQRNRRRHAGLVGEAASRQVAADMANTKDSAVGRLACVLERGLLNVGVRLPYGIRNLVVLRRC